MVTSSRRAPGKSARQKSAAGAPNAERPSAGGRKARAFRSSSRAILIAPLAVAALAAAGALTFELPVMTGALGNTTTAAATFVGSEACAGCHQAEGRLWQSSHHERDIDHVTDLSVLGDFDNASFDY